ncbi:MAG: hypothetical protein WHT46_02810 [Candidatus Geothermincolales bacterium]
MERLADNSKGLGERLARAILSNPRFKANLRRFVGGIDPAHAPGMVRAILWQDAEATLGLASALPRLFNFAAAALEELLRQLNSLPPDMLRAFLGRLVDQLDVGTAARAASELRALAEKAEPVLEEIKRMSGALASAPRTGKEG